jgi:Protein of unknown function (DUF2846)
VRDANKFRLLVLVTLNLQPIRTNEGHHSTLCAALSVILLFSACTASGPQFKPESSKPDGGGAQVIVYRPQTFIGIANPDVPIIHLDGQRLTRIRIGGYVIVPVSAGQHKLTTTESLLGADTGRIRGQTTFVVPPGSTVYLRYTEAFKSFTATPLPKGTVVDSSGDFRFEPVPESEALGELARTTRLELDQKS